MSNRDPRDINADVRDTLPAFLAVCDERDALRRKLDAVTAEREDNDRQLNAVQMALDQAREACDRIAAERYASRSDAMASEVKATVYGNAVPGELYPGLEAAYGMPVDGVRRAVEHALAAAKERIVELEMQQAGIDATLHAGSLVIHVIENIVEEVAKWHEARQAEWDKTLDEARANGAPLADTLIAECYGRMHQESAAALRSGEWKKETK